MGKDNDTDVLIIGAGASGAVAAKTLAEAGMRVVCLEQGGWVASGAFFGDKPEWELTSQNTWHPNPNVRDRTEDYPVEVSDSDVTPLMFGAVGGSTIIYAAHWHRFMPSDFRVRTLDGVADDWPFTYEDLAPFYDYLDEEMGVSGLAGDPAYPATPPPPLPPLPIGKIGLTAARGMNDLGWHWWPAPQAIPSRAYRGQTRPVCPARDVHAGLSRTGQGLGGSDPLAGGPQGGGTADNRCTGQPDRGQ